MDDQHIYHHEVKNPPTVSVKAEKNSKGTNWEVSISGAANVEEAMQLMDSAVAELTSRFGAPVGV